MNQHNSILSADEFWHYTTHRYAMGDIAPLAILLQDKYAVNVNVLLLVCWCLEHGFIINLIQLKEINAAIAQSEDVLIKHRDTRKQARQQLFEQGPNESAKNAYEALKKQELELERQQQSIIVDTVNRVNLVPIPHAKSVPASSVMNASIAALINHYSLRDEHEARSLISQLIQQLP